MVSLKSADANSYFLLGEIFERQGKTESAIRFYRKAAADENLSLEDRAVFTSKIRIPR